MATPPAPPLLGTYNANGAFPTPGPSAWPSGSATNLAGEYFAWWSGWETSPGAFITKCINNNLIPFVELEPWWQDSNGTIHAVLFSDITSGAHDSELTAVGSAIAAAGKPVILTFGHEMNVSGQYPWSQNAKGTLGFTSGTGGTADLTPAQWIAGWKYVHDKVNSTANGNALWMWACSAWTAGTTVNPSPWWPGASYVDMVGIDGYPNTQYGQSLGTFAGQIQQTVTAIRSLGWSDPIFLAETNLAGMVASGGEGITQFVADMHTANMSGIFEFQESYEPDMSAAQWTEYHNAVSQYYGTPAGGGGSGSGSGGAGTGALTVTKGTADEVSAINGVANSVTAISPTAGSMVRWQVAWLNSNDTLGLTFTAQDSNGVNYGAPTLKGNPGDGDGGCYLMVWDHFYQAAPGPITLTVTASGTGVSSAAPSDCLILGNVITGAAADQSSAAFAHFEEVGTSTTTYELNLTTTVPGSVVFVMGAPNDNGGATGPVTANSNTVTDVDWDDVGIGSRGTFGRSKTPTVIPGSTQFGWTSANPSPFGYGVMATEVIPASPGPGGGTTGGSSSGTAFAAVGEWIEVPGTGTSFSWNPTKVGNTLAVICFSETAGAPVTGMSSTNATWDQVVSDQTLGSNTVTEATAFLGTATKLTSAIVNLATTATADNLRILAREFDSNGAAVALDTFVTMDGDALGDVTAWPSITPTKGGNELLFGFERNFNDNAGAAVAGSTSNTVYYVDDQSNGGAVNLGVSSPVAVGWSDSDARTALVILLYAVTAGGTTGSGGTGVSGGSLWYDGAEETELDAKAALLNNGSLKIYTGEQPALNGTLTGTLLVTMAFNATAFAPSTAANGMVTATANAITPGVAVATGKAGYFALVTASGQVVVTAPVGLSGADLNLPSLDITSGVQVGVSSFALTQSETGL